MGRDEIDWSVLRRAIIIFSICVIAGGVLIGGSSYFKKEMLTKYNKNNRQFQNISRKYLAVDEEERLIKKYYPEFLNLYQKGLFGREQRLNWIETIKASDDRIKVPSIKYQISLQEEYSPTFSINMGNFRLFDSNMKLKIDMLHEGDLFRLLEDLNKNAIGTYTVSKCKFKRSGKKVNQDINKGNVSAECELQWFNIKKSDGSEITPS